MDLRTQRPAVLARWVLPVLLAAFFALWSLRALDAGNILDTDAARHAMNGACLRDWVASGQWTHPIEYAKSYYGRYPALSMPYHPPLFPAIEAAFFWLFGVNLFAARLAVALSVAVSVFLLYRLFLHTNGSVALAVCTLVSFCFWNHSQAVAGDVMLEFPAMAFTAAALYRLGGVDREFRMRDGIWFALLAGAALWVKQHAIFLGLVPWLYVVISRRWRLLRSKALWASSLLFGGFVIALWLLTQQFRGAGADQIPPAFEFFEVLTRNARFYFDYLARWMGLIPAVFLLAAYALSLADGWAESRLPGRHLYAAWATAILAVLLWIGPYDVRYLFFALPPLLLMGYHALARIAGMVLPNHSRWAAPCAVAAYTAVVGLNMPAQYLRGPAQAADVLIKARARRVLYCGPADGNFIFAVRERDPHLETVVLSCDKLPAHLFAPGEFERFAHRFGIEHVVLEHPSEGRPYAMLDRIGERSLVWQQDIAMASTRTRWKSSRLSIYRFAHPSPQPERALGRVVDRLGTELKVEF